jgi:hypothetical protein
MLSKRASFDRALPVSEQSFVRTGPSFPPNAPLPARKIFNSIDLETRFVILAVKRKTERKEVFSSRTFDGFIFSHKKKMHELAGSSV